LASFPGWRSYDAIGFYAHMAETGTDPWSRLDAMLKAGGNPAAYDTGVDAEFRQTWGSSLARQASFGSGWDTTGPGIPSLAYSPTPVTISNGSSTDGTVSPYANGVCEIDITADAVDISVSNVYGRLHASNGTEHDGGSIKSAEFCVEGNPICGECTNLKALPQISSGAAWLGVTGDAAGASYTVTRVKASCDACPVGDWTSTQYAFAYSGNNSTANTTAPGGAGIEVEIGETGAMTIDFNGMQEFPVQGTQNGTTIDADGRFVGTETTRMPLPDSTGAVSAAGMFQAPPYGQADITYGGQLIPSEAFGISGLVTWSCTGNVMTFEGNGIATTHWDLQRNS
jgi:hypothetical protein